MNQDEFKTKMRCRVHDLILNPRSDVYYATVEAIERDFACALKSSRPSLTDAEKALEEVAEHYSVWYLLEREDGIKPKRVMNACERAYRILNNGEKLAQIPDDVYGVPPPPLIAPLDGQGDDDE